MYDRTTVQGVYFKHAWSTVPRAPTARLCPVVQWSVHWAPSQMTRVLVLARARRFALEKCRKKNASYAFRLGLIYILVFR